MTAITERERIARLLALGLCLLVFVVLGPRAGQIIAEAIEPALSRTAPAECDPPREGHQLLIAVTVVSGKSPASCARPACMSPAAAAPPRRQVRIQEARR